MPYIRPVSDLRNNFAEISRTVHDTQEPVFLTKNGHGDMVVMSIEAYEKIVSKSKRLKFKHADKPVDKPVYEPVDGLVGELVDELIYEYADEYVAEPMVEQTSEIIMEPVVTPTTESTAKQLANPTVEFIAKPVIEPIMTKTATKQIKGRYGRYHNK